MSQKVISNGVAHKVPPDVQKSLSADKAAAALWENLTPLAREELKQGKRRPCCWIGCIHRKDKAVSPSIQSLVVDKLNKRRTKKK
jgi:hypothetical protein